MTSNSPMEMHLNLRVCHGNLSRKYTSNFSFPTALIIYLNSSSRSVFDGTMVIAWKISLLLFLPRMSNCEWHLLLIFRVEEGLGQGDR